MTKRASYGFDYALDDERLRDYQKKPIELRLAWLYMGNLLRMSYPPEIRKLHDHFRNGPDRTDEDGIPNR